MAECDICRLACADMTRDQFREPGSRLEMRMTKRGAILLIMVDPLETTAMWLSPKQAEYFAGWLKRMKESL